MITVIREFFMLGLLTFGGGMAMIPLFMDIALRYGWLTEAEFSNFIAISQSTPGPIAINMATFIGFVEGNWVGSIVASLVIVFPGFFFSVALSKFLIRHRDSSRIKHMISTMKSAVLALLIYAVYILTRSGVAAHGAVGWGLLAAALVLTFRCKIPILLYLGGFAVMGILFF